MRKLKIFGIICLLSYCTAFVAFATSTLSQPQNATPPVAKTSPLPTTEVLAAPHGIGAKVPAETQADTHVDDTILKSPHAETLVSVHSSAPAVTNQSIDLATAKTPARHNVAIKTPTSTSNTARTTVAGHVPTQRDLIEPVGSLTLPVPLHVSTPENQSAATASQGSNPRTLPVKGRAVPVKGASFSVPLPSGDTLASVPSLPQKTPLLSPEKKLSQEHAVTKSKDNIVKNTKELTAINGRERSLLPIPSGTTLVDAVSLQSQEVLNQANDSQAVYQVHLAIPRSLMPTSATMSPAMSLSEQTLASAHQTNQLQQQNRKRKSILRSIFPANRPAYSNVSTNPSQPEKTKKPWNTAQLLPLPQSNQILFGQRFPLTSHYASSNDFYEAAQSLQSITITPGTSPAPSSSQANFSSLPTPTNTAPMKNQPTAYHQADKKKTFQLTNGLKVILQQDDRFPLVSLRLYVHAGSTYETLPQAGISHVLEHMVFKGSRHYGDGEIAREVENNGGYLNAFTSFDQTGYVVDLPSAQWEKGLSVLKEMAFLPLFNADHLASEKEVIVSELKRGKDSPGNVLFTQMIADMFKDSPYAHPIIGFEDTIRAMTVDDLNAYHQQWYQPQAMTLVVCGNINPDLVEERITKEFSAFANNTVLASPKRDVTPSNKPVVNIQTGPWQKVRLTLAFQAPNLKDNKAVHLDLLTHMIGGDQTSPLFKKYKYDKRLVDSISMQSYNFEESGLVFVMATLDPQNIQAFWQELLNDMQQGFIFSEAELARAQLALQDSFYRSRETLEGYASQIGHFNFYFNGEADAQNYLANIANTDLAMLKSLYTEVFQPRSAGIFGIVPAHMPFEGSTKNQKLAEWLLAELDKRWPDFDTAKTEANKTQPLAQEVITFENGCSLVLLPDSTLPYISATLLFDGGESLLTPQNQGLGALTAGALARGTKTKDYNAIQTFLSERAATLTASSNRQTFGVTFSAPSQFTHDIFGLATEIINSSNFSPEEVDRVKENILADIIRSEEQPVSLAFRHLTAFLYPSHSYGFLHLGTPESIASFTHKDVVQHWTEQQRYPWTLSLCGDFSKEDILELVKTLPHPSKVLPPLPTPHLTKKKELSLTLADREQAHLFLVFPIPGTNSPDEASLELLSNILAGQSGLLFSELRDKQGLGYTVTAFPWKTQKAGALIFYIGTEPENVDVAYKGFTDIIDFLKTSPLENPLLERGKNILAGEYYRDRQSLRARSSEGATFTALGLPLDFKLNLIEQSQTLTADDIQRVAQTYLKLEKSFTIKVLPKNAK